MIALQLNELRFQIAETFQIIAKKVSNNLLALIVAGGGVRHADAAVLSQVVKACWIQAERHDRLALGGNAG